MLLLDAEQALTRSARPGKPPLFVDVRITDAAGADVPPGHTGELLVRGPNVMAGYWRRPDGDARGAHRGRLAPNRRAARDGRRRLRLDRGSARRPVRLRRARSSTRATSNGRSWRIPSVADAGVVGVPAPQGDEVGAAFVVLSAGAAATEDELLAFCRGRLAAHQVPASIRSSKVAPQRGGQADAAGAARVGWCGICRVRLRRRSGSGSDAWARSGNVVAPRSLKEITRTGSTSRACLVVRGDCLNEISGGQRHPWLTGLDAADPPVLQAGVVEGALDGRDPSGGTAASRPPEVCGSWASVTRSVGTPAATSSDPATKRRLWAAPPVSTPAAGERRARRRARAARPRRRRSGSPRRAPSRAHGRAARSRSRRSPPGRRRATSASRRRAVERRIPSIAAARSASAVRPCRAPDTSTPVPSAWSARAGRPAARRPCAAAGRGGRRR